MLNYRSFSFSFGIRQKLIASFLLVILLLGAIIASAIFYMNRLGSLTTDINDKRMPTISSLYRLTEALTTLNVSY